MKNLIIIIILLFGVNSYGQGLGLTMHEIIDQRYDELYTLGVSKKGNAYIQYGCDENYSCTYTMYMLDDIGRTVKVIDVFHISWLDEVKKSLNNENTQIAKCKWYNQEEMHNIELKVIKKENKFQLIYTRPDE